MSAETSLGDHADRTRIAEELESTLFVEAGAGTGKTHALVERIIGLVRRQQVALSSLAAITFTESAAAELRTRVRERLVALAGAEPSDPTLRAALMDVDAATITTIHGFCQRMLADDPLRAGLPLRVRVLDEIEAELDFERRFGLLCDALFDEPGVRDVMSAAVALGVGVDHLRGLARQIEEHWHEVSAAPVEPSALPAAAARAYRAVAAALADASGLGRHCSDPGDRLLERLHHLERAAVSFGAAEGWDGELRAVAALVVPRVGNVGRRASWTGCDIDEVRGALHALGEVRAGALAEIQDAVLGFLLARIAAFARAGAEERRQRGELVFQDLLVRCRDLLRDDAVARRRARRRFSHVLVDEFQDTDELQLEILTLLGAASELEPLDPGRLFFVGDPKQAIYRFRGADVELYERARRALGAASLAHLSTSFRSVPAVLSFVNEVFGPLLQRETDAPVPLAPARSEGSGAGVYLLGGALAASASERRAEEAALVSDAIARVVEEGWEIGDRAGRRSARYGDIALLVTRRTGLGELETALCDAGIPYRLAASALIYAAPEVRDLLAVVRALERPGDERAILAALRSPAFSCSDAELFTFRRGGGRWRLADASPPALAEHPVTQALCELERWRMRRFAVSLPEFLAGLISERGLRLIAAGARRGVDAWRRLETVLSDAAAYAEAGGDDLAGFLSWAERQATRRSREHIAPDPDDDAVRVLTVHAAKGLEFPVVVVAELGSSPRGPSGPTVLRGANGIEARVREGIETLGYAPAAERERTAEREELLRLAYVAATRARDHLVVSLVHQPAASAPARTLAETIALACADRSWPRLSRRATRPPRAVPPVPSPSPEPVGVYRAFLAERRRRLGGSGGRPILAPSALASRLPGAAAGSPPALGRAVHATLARLDLGAPRDVAALAAAAAAREGRPDLAAEVEALVQSALGSAVLHEAATSRCFRELPVVATVGGALVDGVIDLCYQRGEQIVLVDYKTEALGAAAEAPSAAERHRAQVGAYAAALGSVLGRPVTRCLLLFLASPVGSVTVDLGDVAPLVAEVEAALAGTGRGEILPS